MACGSACRINRDTSHSKEVIQSGAEIMFRKQFLIFVCSHIGMKAHASEVDQGTDVELW